jgi:hypothetical protein
VEDADVGENGAPLLREVAKMSGEVFHANGPVPGAAFR